MDFNSHLHNDSRSGGSAPNGGAGYNPGAGGELPMKWYKFLIYFALFASAALNVINGIRYFTGSVYGSAYDAARVYASFRGLKGLDVIMGIGCVALAIYAVLTRSALAGFRAQGPKNLLKLYGATAVLLLAYLIIGTGVTGINLFSFSNILSLVFSGVMVAANKTYFEKRAHLFVN